MTRALLLLLLGLGLGQASAQDALPDLAVADRGEFLLDDKGMISYRPWQLTPIASPGKVGLFMLMPARPSSRKAIAALKQALRDQNYDYHQLISTTVVNLDDAAFGAGMLVGGELKQDKSKTPALRLIVDEDGSVQQRLSFERKQIHVLIHDCSNSIMFAHSGAVSPQTANQIVEMLDQALSGPDCPTPSGKHK